MNIERRKQTVEGIRPLIEYEGQADFWDSQPVVEEVDKEKETVVGLRRSRKTDSLTIRFEPEDIQRIREQADQLGIGPTTLVRMWVLERLRQKGKPA